MKARPHAFLSVYSKTGIEDFARELVSMGWSIIASGGTAKHLREAKVPVIDLATLIGAGEMLNHKVVTLDRKFHAMLLADESKEETVELKKLGVPRIDLVCCDFYPQWEVGQTDIGGPTMVRSAVKGKRIVICDQEDRARVIQLLTSEKLDEEQKKMFWAKAEYAVAQYVLESAMGFGQVIKCPYGENRWQHRAALYVTPNDDPLAHDKFVLIEGNDRSYINFTDIDRLLQSASHIASAFKKNFGKIPAVAIGAKHGNLCGAGVGNPSTGSGQVQSLEKMLSGDPQAISGGWVLVNFPIGKKEAKLLKDGRILDGVIAPSVSDDAIEILARKSGKCRIVVNKALETDLTKLDDRIRFRYVRGGFLTQSSYTFVPDLKKFQVPSSKFQDLILAWAIGSTSNSNTITLVKNGILIANATGQQSRVLACKLALLIAQTAGHNTKGAAAYSDSFFPFIDGPKVLVKAGIKSLLVTSGSIRDAEVFGYFKSKGILVFSLPDEQARGFYAH